jgi:hypothetical protein
MDVTKYLIEHVEKGKKDLKGIDHSIAEFASMNNLPIGEMYHIMSIYFAANLNSTLASHCIDKRNKIEDFYNTHAGDTEI